jgi:hypothetical protein
MSDTTGHIKTHAKELVKQYLVYDGSDRLTDVYTAPKEAVTGTPCQLTRYAYVGVTSRILKRLETTATWDATWDYP